MSRQREKYTFRVDGVVFSGEKVPRKYQKAGIITVRVDTWPWPEQPPKGNTVTLSKKYIIAASRKDS